MCRQWQLMRALPASCPVRSNLAGNELGGSLPTRWARLARLEHLSLEGNRLTGTLSQGWSAMKQLQTM